MHSGVFDDRRFGMHGAAAFLVADPLHRPHPYEGRGLAELSSRAAAYSYVVSLKVREVIKLPEQHDWRHVRTTGDHRIYRSPDGRVTVVQASWATMCVQAHGAQS